MNSDRSLRYLRYRRVKTRRHRTIARTRTYCAGFAQVAADPKGCHESTSLSEPGRRRATVPLETERRRESAPASLQSQQQELADSSSALFPWSESRAARSIFHLAA